MLRKMALLAEIGEEEFEQLLIIRALIATENVARATPDQKCVYDPSFKVLTVIIFGKTIQYTP